MSKTTRYFLQAGNNFTDFSLDYPGVSLAGQQIVIKGTNGIDAAYIIGGYTFDFTDSLDKQDQLYIKGASTEFSASLDINGFLILSRASDSTIIKISNGDRLIFSNGFILSKTWIDALIANPNATTPATDNSITSSDSIDNIANSQLSAGQSFNSVLRAFASGTEGNTLGQVQTGMNLIVKGTNFVDIIYVRKGSQVDFTDSLDGVDMIYLTGYWAEYSKTLVNGTLQLTSTVNPSEIIKITNGNRIVFADGAILSKPLITLLATNSNPSIANLGADWDAGTITPGLGSSTTALITGVIDDAAPLVGAVSKGGSTNDTRLALTGTISAALLDGEHLDIFDGSSKLGSATVTGTSWSYDDTRLLSDTQVVSYTAKVINAKNLAGQASSSYSVNIDTSAPSGYSITGSSFTSSFNGNSRTVTGTASEIIVNDTGSNETLNLTLNKTLASGESIQYSTDAGATWSFANVVGSNISISNPGGEFISANSTLNIRVVDAAGNSSASLVSFSVNVDNTAPIFSSSSAVSVNENIAANSVVYTAVATDSNSKSYSLTGTDASAFSINASTGVVSINNSPDYESKSSYSFDVIAQDVVGNSTSKSVTLSINNLNETGAIGNITGELLSGKTLSAGAVSDPDGEISNISYQWQRLDVVSGSQTWVNITDATTSKLVVSDNEVGHRLRVRATYTDALGVSSTISSLASNHIVGISLNNYTDSGASSTDFKSTDSGASSTDFKSTDNSFDLNAGEVLDGGTSLTASYEQSTNNGSTWTTLSSSALSNLTDGSYQFRAKVTEGGVVTITSVLNVTVDKAAPAFTSAASASVNENVAANSAVYTAVATDSNSKSYSLTGTDASAFSINASTGVVSVKASPNYESKSSFSFNIIAKDAAGNSASQSVTLNINNLNEAGTVAAITGTALVGQTLSAGTLSDPDGGVSATTYQWQRQASDSTTWQDISKATSSTYKLTESDAGYAIRVKLGYTDAQAAGQEAFSTSTANVLGLLLDNYLDAGASSSDKISNDNSFTLKAVTSTNASNTLNTVYQQSLNSGGTWTTLNSNDLSALTEGSYQFRATLTDGAQVRTTNVVSVVVDRTIPSISSAGSFSLDENIADSSAVYTAQSSDSNAVSFSLTGADATAFSIDTAVYTASATDANGIASYSLSGTDAAAFNIDNRGVLSFKVSPDYEAQSLYILTLSATDVAGNVGNALQTLRVNVSNVNEPVRLVAGLSGNGKGVFTLNRNNAVLNVSSDFVDPEGGAVTYSLLSGSLPTGLSLNSSTGVISGTATVAGNRNVTISASDGSGTSVSRAYDIGVYSSPSVVGISVSDSNGADKAGRSGDSVTMVITLSEVLSVSGGSVSSSTVVPSISFGTSALASSAISAVSLYANKLTVTATLPAGDASTVSLTGLSISGVTLTGQTTALNLSNQSNLTVNDNYLLDNTAPTGYSLTSSGFVSVINGVSQTATGTASILPYADIATSGEVLSLTLNQALATGDFVQYSLDGTTWSDAKTLDSTHVSISRDFTGTNNVNLRVADQAGNAPHNLSSLVMSLDNIGPVFTSAPTATVNENSDVTTPIYTALASDDNSVSYLLAGVDVGLFNFSNGVVTLKARADYEAKSSYRLDVIATDTAGNTSTQAVNVLVNNVAEAGTASINGTVAIGQSLTANLIDPDGGISGLAKTTITGDNMQFFTYSGNSNGLSYQWQKQITRFNDFNNSGTYVAAIPAVESWLTAVLGGAVGAGSTNTSGTFTQTYNDVSVTYTYAPNQGGKATIALGANSTFGSGNVDILFKTNNVITSMASQLSSTQLKAVLALCQSSLYSEDILGATGQTYKPTSDDDGYQLGVTIRYNDNAGNTQSAKASTSAHVKYLKLNNYNDDGASSSDFIGTDNAFVLNVASLQDATPITVSYQASSNGGSSWASSTTDLSGLSDGVYQYRALVTEAGATTTSNIVTVVVDKTAPTSYSVSTASFNSALNSITRDSYGTTLYVLPSDMSAHSGESLNLTLSKALTASDFVEYSLDGNSWFATNKVDSRHVSINNVDFTGNEVVRLRVNDLAGNGAQAMSAYDFNSDLPVLSVPNRVSYVENSSSLAVLTADQIISSQGVTWRLATPSSASIYDDDNNAFSIDTATGELSFRSAPNFEQVGGVSHNNSYRVQLTASNSAGNTSLANVLVLLEDGNDPGVVLVTGNARVANVLTAGAVSDEDGVQSGVAPSYQWQRSELRWKDINGDNTFHLTADESVLSSLSSLVSAHYVDGNLTDQNLISATGINYTIDYSTTALNSDGLSYNTGGLIIKLNSGNVTIPFAYDNTRATQSLADLTTAQYNALLALVPSQMSQTYFSNLSSNAMSNIYTPTASDVGTYLRVDVSYSDLHFGAQHAYSQPVLIA